MTFPTEKYRFNLLSYIFLSCVFLFSSGCVHDTGLTSHDAYVGQMLRKASALEQKGDYAAAAEKMEIALTVDPDNALVQEELRRLTVKSIPEAEKHYKTGIAERYSNPQAARKELLEALWIRPDCMEAFKTLREIHAESTVTVVQKRLDKEKNRRLPGQRSKRKQAKSKHFAKNAKKGQSSGDPMIKWMESPPAKSGRQTGNTRQQFKGKRISAGNKGQVANPKN